MRALSARITKAIIGLLVVAIVVGGAYYEFFRGSSTKTVKAEFTSAVGVYVGTPVRILGVNVGTVTKVKPQAQYVEVSMEYDAKYHIRAKGAYAVEVANSLVSDRYINLGTLMSGKDGDTVLKSGAMIPESRTSAPAELDDIYAQLDKLSVALGPKGANKGGKDKGALSALLKVSAANLKGNGKALGDSITNLAAAAQTLSDRKDGLFGTVRNLQKFTAALKQSDSQVRLFNTQLAQVSGDLASERSDLGGALQQLGLALDAVGTFVKANQAKFHTDIKGLVTITDILQRQKASLDETLSIAPVALANITHAYYPQYGAIGTRSNLASLTQVDPTQLVCSVLRNVLGTVDGTVGGAVGGVLGGIIKLPVALQPVLNPICNAKTTPATAATAKSGSTTSSKQVAATPKTATSTAATTKLTAPQAAQVSALLNGGLAPGRLVGSSK